MLFEFAQRKYSRDRRLKALMFSVVLHICLVSGLIVVPLILFERLPDVELITFLSAPPDVPPPPPPPPPPSPAQYQSEPVVAEFTVPREMPRSIPPPDPEIDPPVIDRSFSLVNSVPGGVPGGVAGGSALGIIGGILGKQAPLPPPPPPEETPSAKIPVKSVFVGGDVQTAKLIDSVPAEYPDLALKARISGIVLLRITVNEEGKVADIKIISGHPLLSPAAVAAVHQWKYSPTLLNGHPVRVIATVAVNFQLQ